MSENVVVQMRKGSWSIDKVLIEVKNQRCKVQEQVKGSSTDGKTPAQVKGSL